MAPTDYVITGKRVGHRGTVVIDFRTLADVPHRIAVPFAESDVASVDRTIRAVLATSKPRPGRDL